MAEWTEGRVALVENHLRLARKYANQFWRSAPWTADLDDYLGEANLELVKSALDFDPGRAVHSKGSFLPYVTTRLWHRLDGFRKVRNNARGVWRTPLSVLRPDSPAAESVLEDRRGRPVPDEVHWRMVAEDVRRTLHPRERQVFDLRLQGLNPRQAAAELGVSRQAAYQAERRTREMTKSLFGERGVWGE